MHRLAATLLALALLGGSQLLGEARPLLVRLAPDSSPSALSSARHLFGPWYRVDAGPLTLEQLGSLPGVVAAEEDPPLLARIQVGRPLQRGVGAALAPNDPAYPLQWHLDLIGMPVAWEHSTGEGVTIAIIGSGVSSLPLDLSCHTFQDPYNAITGETGPGAAEDTVSHSTHVAGTAAQCTDNGHGVAGVAFDAELMPVKVLESSFPGNLSDLAAGIRWAVDHGADVLNISVGSPCDGPWESCQTLVLTEAIDYAIQQGVVVVAEAGDRIGATASGYLSQPANHPDVLAVAAVDAASEPASYSNSDDTLAHEHLVAAPGGDIDADLNEDGQPDGVLQETLGRACGVPQLPTWFCWFDGTSMATPHVAGAAALLKSAHPEATRLQILQALEESAIDLGEPGRDALFGHGLVQLPAALIRLAEIVIPPEPFECVADSTTLCVEAHGDDWEVTMSWTRLGQGGQAQAISLEDAGITQGGSMAFTNGTNPEVLLKILNGCPLNGHLWVFFAATTDAAFNLQVRQASTGLVRVYTNPEGRAAIPVQDASAFVCPSPEG